MFKDLYARLSDTITSFSGRILGRFPEGKRRPILFAFGGVVVFLFILVISILALGFRKPGSPAGAVSAGPLIPAEELFIPEEPDFVPEYLLEREPRSSWTIEDIRPYWKNPEDPGLWRGEIQSAVDELMEAVP